MIRRGFANRGEYGGHFGAPVTMGEYGGHFGAPVTK
jgi:hypothetical protein